MRKLALDQTSLEVLTEVAKYGPWEAVTDAGGFLGLFLGASILGAFDVAEGAATGLLRRAKEGDF